MLYVPITYAPPGPSQPIDEWPADSASVYIEWAAETTVVGEEHLHLLVFADPDEHVYHFDQGGAAAAGLNLSQGRMIFIYGYAVRQIRTVTPAAGTLILETDFIELTAAIENAVIDWDMGIDFDPADVSEVVVAGQTLVPDADGQIAFEFKQGDFTYNLVMTLKGDKATVDFKVTKSMANALRASLTAVGNIERFRVKNNITIENHELVHLSHGQEKMRGDMTVGLIATATGSDRVNIELPVVLLKIPAVVAGIPVVVNIKVQFVFFAEVPLDGSAQVSTRFVYDSDMGLSYDGTQVKANARVGNLTFDALKTQTGASNPISANFGMGYPRVELGIFGETIVPWAQIGFNVGGSYTMFPACQTADAILLGAAGLNLGFLGVKVNLGSTTFFRQERKLLRAGNCPN
jgi:hypothetical protein